MGLFLFPSFTRWFFIIWVEFYHGSWNGPFWVNGLGTVVTVFLAYVSFSLIGKEK